MKAAIIYQSISGNTKKVATTIESVLKEQNITYVDIEITSETNVDLHDYDLVFFGAPSYRWIPPKTTLDFINREMDGYRKGVRPVDIRKASGKFSVVFCTYGGIHTGIKEGVTAGLYMGQFLEHMGFFVLDTWYTPGNFMNWTEGSTYGRLGNITERPNEDDLFAIKKSTEDILSGLHFLY